MYLKISQDFFDSEFYYLTEMLEHLDVKVKDINNKINLSTDPDADGLFDKGEYFIGVGFSLIQQYFSCTYPQLGVKRDDALRLGEKVTSEVSYARAIHAGANYWKHQDEWGLINCITRDIKKLNNNAKYTIQTIELLTPWADYTCANLLAELVGDNEFSLSSLLPYIALWRTDLDNVFGGANKQQAL